MCYNLDMDIITHKEARQLGLPKYFTGKPCKHGHISERYTLGGTCVTCAKGWASAQRLPDGYRTQWGKRHRLALITKLGGKCVRCGFDDPRALQIDHVNGGGAREVHSFPNRHRYYKHLLSDVSDKYQLLCANCNWIKREENKECFKTDP
jgi:hypothetical protein